MNRHRSNWSVMGAGLTGKNSPNNLTSKEDVKKILLELFKTPFQFEQFCIIVEALKEIKDELNIK